MKFLPKVVKKAYRDTYMDEARNIGCEWWYNRFIWYFLKAGIPKDGVAGIIKAHKIPVSMVKRYGASSGLIPEQVAKNVLAHRHDPVEYDSLARPRIRVTKKKIADFRKKLEEELRRIWSDQNSLEETIREECYDSTDEYIAHFILGGTKPEIWAQNLNDI